MRVVGCLVAGVFVGPWIAYFVFWIVETPEDFNSPWMWPVCSLLGGMFGAAGGAAIGWSWLVVAVNREAAEGRAQ